MPRKKLEKIEPEHSTPIPMVIEVHHTRWEWTPRWSFVVGFCVGMAVMSFLFVAALVSSSRSHAVRAAGYSGIVR